MNPPYIEQLNITLGKSLIDSSYELSTWCEKLSELYNLKKNGTIVSNYDITIIEIYILVLYTIVSIATFFRADFTSNIEVEKRLNLRYLCFISVEFYKSLFIVNKPNTLWQKFELILSNNNQIDLLKIRDKINDASSEFKSNYFRSQRRDISLHYDYDLDIVYQHICDIDEENESKQTASLLATLEPLSLICSIYLKNRYPQKKIIKIPQENNIHKQFRKELYKRLYDFTGSHINKFAEHLDQNMSTYHMIDRPEIKELLTQEDYKQISQFRECFKLSILIHYFYLDLGTAMRGYLRSDNFFEQQLHVIRINLIIYEGFKKIFLPKNDDKKRESLWVQYVYIPIKTSGNSKYIDELESIEKILCIYATNEEIKKFRHLFSHFRKNNKLQLIDLWDSVITINPIVELNKALDFLKIIDRIIKLSKPCLEYFAKKENERHQQNILVPLETVFTKIIGLCKTPEEKERLQSFKNELKEMILGTFDRMIQLHKCNNHE